MSLSRLSLFFDLCFISTLSVLTISDVSELRVSSTVGLCLSELGIFNGDEFSEMAAIRNVKEIAD